MKSIAVVVAVVLFAPLAHAQDSDLVDRERTRIQAHLAHVHVVLSRRDTSHLTEEQRANRTRLLVELAEYRDAGRFPINTRHPNDYIPYFIDDHGTACAVGYLMIEDGAQDLAHAIQAAENNAYVPDMTTPGLADWAEQSGFTADELAMIQPSYCGPDFDAGPCDDGGGGGGGCSASGTDTMPWLALLALIAIRRR